MDTDDLTPMAYSCIVIANQVSGFLKTDFGAAASKYSNEDDYLKGILKFVLSIKRNPMDYLESWNLEDEIDVHFFKQGINELLGHIKLTINTPFSERGPLIDW